MNPAATNFGKERDVELRELEHLRKVLMKDIQNHKNRQETPFVSSAVSQIYDNVIDALEKQLKEVLQRINEFFLKHQDLAEQVELLITMKGVAKTTAIVFLAYCPELGTLSRKAAGVISGTAPCTRQSGSTYMGSHISGGRKELRNALYMAAMVAIRYDPEMYMLYDRLTHKGKPHKVALTAVMRHLFICDAV